MIQDLLNKKNCFKLICGAGKEDVQEVKRLVYVYALAGCGFFDLSPNIETVMAAKEALNLANIEDAYLCVSFGLANDPHAQKAQINKFLCTKCGNCSGKCPENAIISSEIVIKKCIGCKKCKNICPNNAIEYISSPKELKEILPPLKELNIDCIELHAMGTDDEEVISKWEYLNNNFNGILSVCTSRGNLSDSSLIERIKKMLTYRKPYTTIIQADGFPMSGGNDDYKTTLQAVATAQIVQNADLPIYLLLSGGTNSKTADLAKMCGINFHGISIGSFARKIIREYVSSPDFWDNKNSINTAIKIAKSLIETTKK